MLTFLYYSLNLRLNTVSDCTKVQSSKVIGNLVAKSIPKFVCVRKFVSIPMFDQNVRNTSYQVVKKYDFEFVIKVIVDTKCPASVGL